MQTELQLNTTRFGFRVDSVTGLPDADGRMWRFTFEKNGAQLVWLERQDEVKTFVIAFKTLPEDDTGVAHILEHTVLAGSQKYPVKSPFDELRKSSLRVFMNAMTARDKTYYPFSTRNHQDFLNLAGVYLDAVFNPKVLRSPLAFRQEGWHYEIDETTGELLCNGVVYNEMKGVFADPERAAGRDVLHLLYPDTVYGNDSGGKPEAIPSLSYEAFRAFHARYYHPSNARIFLDGSVDLDAVLPLLAAYLEPYERLSPLADIPFQAPVFAKKTIPFTASVCEGKTVLADAWAVGTFRDLDRRAALDALIEYLAGSNEAPLKRALVSAGLCEDVKLFWYSYLQMPLVLIVRNTSPDLAEKCRECVRSTLEQLLADGLDRARLRAIVDNNEFLEREVDGPRPRGVVYFSRAINQWLHGGDPAAEFDITGIYRRLREGIETGFFEACLREMVLENPHRAELTYLPTPARDADPATRIAEKLAQVRAALTPREMERIVAEHRELRAYQTREDSPADKATVPALSLADIPVAGTIPDHTVTQEGPVTVIKTRATCTGVVYLSLYFPLDGLDADDLAKIPLFARLYGKLATRKREAFALQTDLLATVGRLKVTPIATVRGNYLRVKLSVLSSKVPAAVALLQELLLETQFDDLQTVRKIQKQQVLAMERRVRMRGDSLAEAYAARTLSRRWASRDILSGYTALRRLQRGEVSDVFTDACQRLARRIFVRNGLVLSCTDNLPGDAEQFLKTFLPFTDAPLTQQTPIAFRAETLQALRIDGDAGYSGTVAQLPASVAFTGALRVAAKIISTTHLYREIREKGGAYGTGMQIIPSGFIFCYTYRDPTPVRAGEIIRASAEALRAFVSGDGNLERMIVATIAGMDATTAPEAEASRPAELYLAGRTRADEDRARREVIETSREILLRLATVLEQQLTEAQTFIVGGARQTAGLVAEPLTP